MRQLSKEEQRLIEMDLRFRIGATASRILGRLLQVDHSALTFSPELKMHSQFHRDLLRTLRVESLFACSDSTMKLFEAFRKNALSQRFAVDHMKKLKAGDGPSRRILQHVGATDEPLSARQ